MHREFGSCPFNDVRQPSGTLCTADRSLCTDDVCDGGVACTHPLRAGTTCDGESCTCDHDGLFCTGPVRCEEGGLCIQLPPPCEEDDTCDEERDLCLSPLGTPRPTATLSPTAPGAPTPTPTATPTAIEGLCTGDCDGSRTVSADEILFGIDIALGVQPISACGAFDGDHDGRVAVNDLVFGVANALTTCPSSP